MQERESSSTIQTRAEKKPYPLGKTYYAVLGLLREKQEENPNQPITINKSEVGRELSVSRQRVDQIVDKVNLVYPEMNIIATQTVKRELKILSNAQKGQKRQEELQQREEQEKQITQLRKEGKDNKEIIEKLKINKNTFQHLVSKLIRKGKIEPQKEKRSREEIKNFDNEVRRRDEKGLTQKEIAIQLNLDPSSKISLVTESRRRLIKAGLIKPKTQVTLPPEFYQQLIELYDLGGCGRPLTRTQLAESMEKTKSQINNGLHRLFEKGIILSRREKARRQTEASSTSGQ